MLEEALSYIVLLEHGYIGYQGDFRWCATRTQVEHPFQGRKLSVDGCVHEALVHPFLDVTFNLGSGDLAGLHPFEFLKEIPGAPFGLLEGAFLIDPIVDQIVFNQIVEQHPIKVNRWELPLRDLSFT